MASLRIITYLILITFIFASEADDNLLSQIKSAHPNLIVKIEDRISNLKFPAVTSGTYINVHSNLTHIGIDFAIEKPVFKKPKGGPLQSAAFKLPVQKGVRPQLAAEKSSEDIKNNSANNLITNSVKKQPTKIIHRKFRAGAYTPNNAVNIFLTNKKPVAAPKTVLPKNINADKAFSRLPHYMHPTSNNLERQIPTRQYVPKTSKFSASSSKFMTDSKKKVSAFKLDEIELKPFETESDVSKDFTPLKKTNSESEPAQLIQRILVGKSSKDKTKELEENKKALFEDFTRMADYLTQLFFVDIPAYEPFYLQELGKFTTREAISKVPNVSFALNGKSDPTNNFNSATFIIDKQYKLEPRLYNVKTQNVGNRVGFSFYNTEIKKIYDEHKPVAAQEAQNKVALKKEPKYELYNVAYEDKFEYEILVRKNTREVFVKVEINQSDPKDIADSKVKFITSLDKQLLPKRLLRKYKNIGFYNKEDASYFDLSIQNTKDHILYPMSQQDAKNVDAKQKKHYVGKKLWREELLITYLTRFRHVDSKIKELPLVKEIREKCTLENSKPLTWDLIGNRNDSKDKTTKEFTLQAFESDSGLNMLLEVTDDKLWRNTKAWDAITKQIGSEFACVYRSDNYGLPRDFGETYLITFKTGQKII